MVSNNVYRLNSWATNAVSASPSFFSRMIEAVRTKAARAWCGLQGHLIGLHFEPYKLSLQCALCGYASEGWEVGRPLLSRAAGGNRIHPHTVRHEPRRLKAVPSNIRMAS